MNNCDYIVTFSDDKWDYKDAQVVCRWLGLKSEYAEATIKSRYGKVSSTAFTMDDVECQGTEETLDDCSYNPVNNCKGNEAAGVICHGRKRKYLNFNNIFSVSDSPQIYLVNGRTKRYGNVLFANQPIW